MQLFARNEWGELVSELLQAINKKLELIESRGDKAIFISLKSHEQLAKDVAQIEALGSADKPLCGLIFAVKDNIDVAGLETTAACPAFAYTPDRSAVVVEKLQAAGAIVLGKTNLDQFATGLVGVRSPYGVPRNVLRADLVPGGSSSGSAVAVAAGLVDFALGTDTAGSGRIPAGMNGIVGLKPSLGLLSSTGMLPACRTLDTISIFSRDVRTAARVAAVAAGYDATDAYSRELPVPRLSAMPRGLRIGVPRVAQRLFFGDQPAEEAYAADLETMQTLGASIVEIDFEPLHAVARLLYEGPWVAERYSATKSLLETHPDEMLPITRSIIEPGRTLTAVATFEAYYRLAELRRKAEQLLAEIDCLAAPTIPRFYTLEDLAAEPVRYNSNLGSYTNFVNLLDLCAISVPAGMRSDRLPSSLTFIASAGRDGFVASIAAAVENNEAVRPADRAPGLVELAVVGAHLTGLPLNRELVELGATFVREAETTPDYKLFALEGTVPPKPGLLRTERGVGRAIKAEIWALEPAAFGKFVANIPGPLGVGTLQFSDGSQAKGFLVEAVATQGQRDISEFGGWRAYLSVT
ncbi:MAG: putative glutamyl-tRNA(Gln) amidotransferase subunit [Rhizobium sp.]|nr:putative glutamyl-tRNA(Gln) amidotransferase subunit [Rhizobium sp.]